MLRAHFPCLGAKKECTATERGDKVQPYSGSVSIARNGASGEAAALEAKYPNGVSHRMRLERGKRVVVALSLPKLASVDIDCNIKDRFSCKGTLQASNKRGSLKLEKVNLDGDAAFAKELLVRLPTSSAAVTVAPTLRAPLFLGGSCEVELSPRGEHSVKILPPSADTMASITRSPIDRNHPIIFMRIGPADGAHTILKYRSRLRCEIAQTLAAKGSQATFTAALTDSLRPSLGFTLKGTGKWGNGSAYGNTQGGAGLSLETELPQVSLSLNLSSNIGKASPSMSIRGIVFL
jgi:hypothetical protein